MKRRTDAHTRTISIPARSNGRCPRRRRSARRQEGGKNTGTPARTVSSYLDRVALPGGRRRLLRVYDSENGRVLWTREMPQFVAFGDVRGEWASVFVVMRHQQSSDRRASEQPSVPPPVGVVALR